jgi:sarcosine oxidase subunit alpha
MRLHERGGRSLCGPEWCDARLADVRAAGVDVRLSASACATFDDGTIVITADRALWVRAKARVFCNGCHEAIESFGDNDLPGVYTTRAVARALRYGVRLGERVLVTGHGDEERALAAALSAAGSEVVRLSPGETLLEATGVGSVSGALVRGASSTHKIKCDAIASSSARTPAFELAGQAGVEIVHDGERRCYAVRADEEGRTERRDVFAAGSVALGGRAMARELAVVQAVVAYLGGRS